MTDGLRLRAYYAATALAAWLLYRVLGFRRRVVRDNLERSFPAASMPWRRAIGREFARRQGELAAEVLYATRIDADELRARVALVNPAVLAAAAAPRPMILVGAHHGNFEWMLQRVSLELGERLVGLYKPLGNRRADAWFRRMRGRFGARMIAAKSLLQELARFRDAQGIGFLADQVPRTSPEKHWVGFLGQDTAFYMGPELIARALRSPACLVRMRRLARGRYEIEFVPLNVAGEKLPHGELTARYARALEAWIRDDPAGWWWSHRRWKLRRGVYGAGAGD
jgi:Kdo2-lipid IVA lauroyltransferase/acyltransferase